MRIRSTKPDFWRSDRIASVSWDARLVLKGLESYVDDNGVGKDDMALIVGDLFQRDAIREPSRTLARVSEAISELHKAGLVHRYTANDDALLFISFWEQVQRVDKPQPGRFPRPDGTKDYKDSQIRECVANIRESSRTLAPGTGEQGNRGTGEKSLVTLGRGSGGNPRGTRLPDGWCPTSDVVAQMRSDHPHVDVKSEYAKFCDYWHSKAGKDARKTDWDATFRNWIRRAAENQPRAPTATAGRLQGADLRAAEYQALKAELRSGQ